MNQIHHHARNTRGRDFVAGDVHGDSDRIFQAMHGAGFMPGVDRLFVVGNLIGYRTPGNAIPKLLGMNGFHPVLGRFESMLLDHVRASGIDGTGPLHPALSWWHVTSLRERGDIAIALSSLPVGIELEVCEVTMGLVHADVPNGLTWQEYKTALQRNQLDAKTIYGASKRRQERTHGVIGVDHVMVGRPKPVASAPSNISYIGTPWSADDAPITTQSRLRLHRLSDAATTSMSGMGIITASVNAPQRVAQGAAC